MSRQGKVSLVIGLLIVTAFFAACGKDGESSNGMEPTPSLSYMLLWSLYRGPRPAVRFIGLFADLYHYELYVSATENFSDKGTSVAFVCISNGRKSA